jgi:hypothetical protein
MKEAQPFGCEALLAIFRPSAIASKAAVAKCTQNELDASHEDTIPKNNSAPMFGNSHLPSDRHIHFMVFPAARTREVFEERPLWSGLRESLRDAICV